MTTLSELQQELDPYKNTLVIDIIGSVVRLVDVIDGEEDFYWVFDNKDGIHHSSCVMGWTPLKGFIREDDYNKMVRIWNLNNIEKAE